MDSSCIQGNTIQYNQSLQYNTMLFVWHNSLETLLGVLSLLSYPTGISTWGGRHGNILPGRLLSFLWIEENVKRAAAQHFLGDKLGEFSPFVDLTLWLGKSLPLNKGMSSWIRKLFSFDLTHRLVKSIPLNKGMSSCGKFETTYVSVFAPQYLGETRDFNPSGETFRAYSVRNPSYRRTHE